MWRVAAMTCLLDRETYRRWESYFNGNGLPLPAHYEMRDYTPAPLPNHPQVPRQKSAPGAGDEQLRLRPLSRAVDRG